MVSTPLKNMIVKMGSSSPNRGENKTYLKPPPTYDSFVAKKHDNSRVLNGCHRIFLHGSPPDSKTFCWEGTHWVSFHLSILPRKHAKNQPSPRKTEDSLRARPNLSEKKHHDVFLRSIRNDEDPSFPKNHWTLL